MPDDQQVSRDQIEAFAGKLVQLIDLAMREPATVIAEADRITAAARECDMDLWPLHYLYFVAFSSLIAGRGNEPLNTERRIAHALRAAEEYALARKIGARTETIEYDEEVVVRPGGLFRKAKTEKRKRSRVETIHAINEFSTISKPWLDLLSESLVQSNPEALFSLLPNPRFKYLATAQRVRVAPAYSSLFEHMLSSDIAAIGELGIPGEGPIGFVFIGPAYYSMRGDEADLTVMSFTKEPGQEGSSPVGVCHLEKKNGSWRVRLET